MAIHGHGKGGNSDCKPILVGFDNDAEPRPQDEWNYDLGSLRVYIHHMRVDEGAESGKDAGGLDKFVD
jgi:hypothetical protein